MSLNQMLIAFFVLNCAARVRGCFRRWRQPLLRGPEWFFNVRVQPGFYAGAGRKILHNYRLRMFAPIAIEMSLAVAIFISGQFFYLYWLLIGATIAVHANHLFNVNRAEHQAREFAVPEAEQPVSSVVLSLKPRRLRDYSSRRVEQFIILASAGVLAWLVRYYLHSPGHPGIRAVFGGPAWLLYCQLGLLLVKYGVVVWRTPIPQAQAEDHLQAREAARKLYLRVCDWGRIFITANLMFWPLLLTSSAAMRHRLVTFSWIMAMAVTVVLGVWQEMERRRVLKTILRARPTKLPDLLHTENSGRLVCYQPATPMLLVRGARGYSLNLANNLMHLGAAYVAGLIALFALLRVGR
ncbi:MAG: hypothetical protein ACM3SW_07570 [Actinomycetota bacterium]